MFGRNKTSVDVHAAQQMATDDGYTIVDVRTKRERQQGHPPGSLHVSLESLQQRLPGLKNKKVLAICRSGNRSGTATKFLVSQGVDAQNIKGGMIAWNRAGLPIKTGK